MNRQTVESSAIRSIGHDGETLEVEMNSGKVYQYAGVSRDHFEALLSAESIGAHFGKHIRGQFEHALLDDESEPGNEEGQRG